MSRGQRDDVDIIELVAADPTAFGGAPVAVVDTGLVPREPREPSSSNRRWPAGLLVVVLVGAAATVGWKIAPWHGNDVLYVRDHIASPVTLTSHLVIDNNNAVPIASYLGAAATTSVTPATAQANVISTGAVFVASSPTGGSTSTPSILYWRVPSGSNVDNTAIEGATKVTVQGMPGTVWDSGSGVLVRWTLADGSQDTLQARAADTATALRIANVLSVDTHGTVVVRHRSALGPFHPAGTVNDVQAAVAGFNAAASWSNAGGAVPAANERSVDLVDYGEGMALAIGPSVGPDALALIRAVLPTATTDVQVHGHVALSLPLNRDVATDTTLSQAEVLWVEGGRILTVSGGTQELALQYAQSVRPATEAEWQQVVKVQQATS
jgi:hypothetical protein